MISLQTRLSGGMGSKRFSGTTLHSNLQKFAITSTDDTTTFTSIGGVDSEGNPVDVLDEMGLTGVTLTKDMGTWYCASDVMITSIKLATGSVKLD